jgi:hypothetical protein
MLISLLAMNSTFLLNMVAFLALASAHASADQSSAQAADPKPKPRTQTGSLGFPTYTPEKQREIKSLKGGSWYPIKIDRHYVILRGDGIRLERGDYFLQPLSDDSGKLTKFLLSKKRGIKLNKIDFNKAKASDGSFAEVLDIVAEIELPEPETENKAYVSSSGESGWIVIRLAGKRYEWRGELMGLAGPSEKLVPHP